MKKITDEDPLISQTTALKLLQSITLLKADSWTPGQLAKRLDISERTSYRYIQLLEFLEFAIDKDKTNRYFIVPDSSIPGDLQLCLEERKFIRSLIQASRRSPLKTTLLKKFSTHIKAEKGPKVFTSDDTNGEFIEQLAKAMRSRHRVKIMRYHSGNSSSVSDRLVEPITFGDNYQTIFALDTNDMICKQFRLDRMGEVRELRVRFKHEVKHKEMVSDCFGFTGNTIASVTLRLSFRAHLKLKEDHPLSIRYITQTNDGYLFKGPVSNFEGICQFVFSQVKEIVIEEPTEFKDFARKWFDGQTLL